LTIDVNEAGDVLLSSILALLWPGDQCHRKVVGLVGPGPCRVRRYLRYQCSDEVPACVEETVAAELQKSDFASFWLFAKCTKKGKKGQN